MACSSLADEALVIIEESKKDDDVDADGDGKADVKQIGNRENESDQSRQCRGVHLQCLARGCRCAQDSVCTDDQYGSGHCRIHQQAGGSLPPADHSNRCAGRVRSMGASRFELDYEIDCHEHCVVHSNSYLGGHFGNAGRPADGEGAHEDGSPPTSLQDLAFTSNSLFISTSRFR